MNLYNAQKAGAGKCNRNYVEEKRCRGCEWPRVCLPGRALQFSTRIDSQKQLMNILHLIFPIHVTIGEVYCTVYLLQNDVYTLFSHHNVIEHYSNPKEL